LGRFKILNREQEVAVARSIERYKISIKEIIFSSLAVLEKLLECQPKLINKEIRLEDIVSPETCRWFAPENIKKEKTKVLNRLGKIGKLVAEAGKPINEIQRSQLEPYLKTRLELRSKIMVEIEQFNFNLEFLENLTQVFKTKTSNGRRYHRPQNSLPHLHNIEPSSYLYAEELPADELDRVIKRLGFWNASWIAINGSWSKRICGW
jgi:hypothetical protein